MRKFTLYYYEKHTFKILCGVTDTYINSTHLLLFALSTVGD